MTCIDPVCPGPDRDSTQNPQRWRACTIDGVRRECRNLYTDRDNCGECGYVCPSAFGVQQSCVYAVNSRGQPVGQCR